MASTPHGLPYPVPTDPVSAGADAIRALAEALEAMLAGTIQANSIALSGQLDATGNVIVRGALFLPTNNPGTFIELAQGGSLPNPSGGAAARLYCAWNAATGRNKLDVVWPTGTRTTIATEP